MLRKRGNTFREADDVKMTILISSLIAAGVLLICQQSSAETGRITGQHHITFAHRHHEVESHSAASEQKPEITGAVPHAFRDGNPLELLSPFASRKYGTAEENVVLDPSVPGKWDGIKLLSISF